MPVPRWEAELREAAREFDWQRVAEIAGGYVQYLRSSGARASVPQAKAILALLRENLRYDELLEVADSLLGQGIEDGAVRRQLAQGLVDRDRPAASLVVFRDLVDDPAVTAGERAEARGGVGRCYKQLYVLNSAPSVRSHYLQLALTAYRAAYEEDHRLAWHGINAVALLSRGERDGVGLAEYPDAGAAARSLAAEILAAVESEPDPDGWQLATACEACLALGRDEDAMEWLSRFVADRDADAFKLASFLRQLLQIWQLDTVTAPGESLLPVLRSALLAQAGGSLVVASADVQATRLAERVDPALERVLGTVRYRSLTWYRTGLERCRAVARIENENEDGLGTGFLLRAGALHPALPETVFVTNGHVMPEALDPRDAVVVFHGLDSDDGPRQRFRIVRRWWYEPSQRPHLDTTLLELDGLPDQVTAVPGARALPRLAAQDAPRAYVIGHPRGLAQPQFSLQDNVLLDYDETFLHYRSPTEPGSSGSPVFDNEWKLIGLHHAGGADLPRLRRQGGSYAANEAISLPAIVAGLLRRPPVPEAV